MKYTIYIVINSEYEEPLVFTSEKDAAIEVQEDILNHAKYWGYTGKDELEDVQCAIDEFDEARRQNKEYCGTYLGELEVGYYKKEIEL